MQYCSQHGDEPSSVNKFCAILLSASANIVVEIVARNSWQLMHFRKIVIILFILAKKCRKDLHI